MKRKSNVGSRTRAKQRKTTRGRGRGRANCDSKGEFSICVVEQQKQKDCDVVVEEVTAETTETKDEYCFCKDRLSALQSRIFDMEQLLEQVLGQMESENKCSAVEATSSVNRVPVPLAVEPVVLGQPGMEPPLPLHIAAKRGNALSLVRALANSADPNALDSSGNTALHCAARSGIALSVELLLAGGASLTVPNAHGTLPLTVAMCRGHLDVVEVLLQSGASMEERDKEGRTLLMQAVYIRNLEMVSLLLNRGASLNVVDQHGLSPLVFASQNCLLDILHVLIRHGSPYMAHVIQAMSVAGSSPIFMSLFKSKPIAAVCTATNTVLAHVAKEGWVCPVIALLNNCMEWHCQSEIHHKSLSHAILVAKTAEILALLWKSAPEKTRMSAMLRAATMGWDTAFKRMLQHWNFNKDDTSCDAEVEELLRVAVSPAIALWLLETRPGIAQSRAGRNLAWRAAEHDWPLVLGMLLKAGVSVNSMRSDGSNLLHVAATRGHLESVRCLLRFGPSLLQTDEDGWTPLHMAADAGHRRVVEVLLQSGADPKVKDPRGLTPSDVSSSAVVISQLKGHEKLWKKS